MPTKKDKLMDELNALKEDVGTRADLRSVSQDAHKFARIKAIEAELAQLDNKDTNMVDGFGRGISAIKLQAQQKEQENEAEMEKAAKLYAYNQVKRIN